ncbi:unnamed protein product (macronuclear) [Paramecium tetraurelia]|uniref:Uncharacterized protein n=1 Tax=Paramecium tetraurelia TaxID=5888 RepID=A0CQ16_PARTE|nr:uncharacterized protein GSPATT00038840001 [Paramecium tetraurelia]CAK72883.1 unnamed protein product [Paramecium tetraurelia]|eukprot:XP_001440280.1 hypothetical protein (macronuclear) [Paramecium tetraurelia strain d4-2]
MNNNQFQTRQWEQQYAKHKRSVEQIEHRNYKFPDQVEEIIQRCKNITSQSRKGRKQKEVLSRITASNLILSKKLQEIEKRRQVKFMQYQLFNLSDAPVRLSTKSLREENYNKIKVENHKQFERITQVKGTLQTQ